MAWKQPKTYVHIRAKTGSGGVGIFLTERDVIDYIVNGYGEIFFEFLLNANCLNGRNYYHNDFTYVQNVSTKGSSVVDYCVIPYENLRHYANFEVKRASVM